MAHDDGCACQSCVRPSLLSALLLDPMNALTNLTGVGGGPGTIGMGPRPPGAPMVGMGPMGPMQIGQHAMGGVPGNPQARECVSFMWFGSVNGANRMLLAVFPRGVLLC